MIIQMIGMKLEAANGSCSESRKKLKSQVNLNLGLFQVNVMKNKNEEKRILRYWQECR